MPAPIQQPFERKEYDVTNTLANTIAAMCGWPCALMNKQQLILEPEEAVLQCHIFCAWCDTNTTTWTPTRSGGPTESSAR